MGRLRTWVMAVVLAVVITGAIRGVAPAAPPPPVQFTAAGDYNTTANTTAVLNGIAAATPDLSLALGDMSYGVTGQEQAFCDLVTGKLGAGRPFELVSGNHESNGQNGNINDFGACLPNQLPGAVGTYGRQYYLDVPAANPQVRFVMISPNLPFPDGTWSYAAGTPRYAWTAAAIDGARAANIPWVVVGMHKVCVSVGIYGCEPGADLYNMLLSKKVDLVLNGHEHLYQRTKQLGLGPGCTSLTIGSYNPACVVDANANMVAGAGTVFATAGTGGTPLRDVNPTDSEAGYFAAFSGLNQNATYGFLDITADVTTLSATFVPAAGAGFTDSFTLTKGATPANQPPTASFTSSSTGLTASFDASASADADGTISSYAWDFGDSTSGTGVSPNHPYAAAGTYNVTLTVTDDDGATGSLTKPVTVTAPGGPTVLASDNFERTVSSGWGTAPTGGSWTGTTGTAAGVGSGTGRLTMATAGTGPSENLASLSTTDLDAKTEVTLDKVPAGGTTGLIESLLLRRVAGQGDYAMKVSIVPSGAVKVTLSRTTSAGVETVLSGPVTVAGLTYTAGTSLTLRGEAVGTNPTVLRAKVWRTGQAEPAAWTTTASNSQAELQSPGYFGVKSYLSSATTNAPIVSRFDNLSVVLASTLQ